MGRAERRRAERRNRIENRKGKLVMSREELNRMRDNLREETATFNVESLMTCFALAEHRLYGFGKTRILRTLEYIDTLMADIISNQRVMDDYKKELEDIAGVSIVCQK